LGIDPGTVNYGIAGLDKQGKLVFARMLNNTIWSMAQKNAHLRRKYMRVMNALFLKLSPRAVICENFTVRGFATNLIELVGVMAGIMQVCADTVGCSEYMVMPSSWKRNFEKHANGWTLQYLYDEARIVGVPPHIVDAICLATYLYGNESFLGLDRSMLLFNVKEAANLIQPYRKIKPKRINHGLPNHESKRR
jgi:hypothetical protein